MRLPRPLYRRGWGWLLGRTFLQITHVGRRSGEPRETVAMALTYDSQTHEVTVCSAWGPNTDWILNLRANPALRIQIGREAYEPELRFLAEDEAVAAALAFRDRHPWRMRLIAKILGWGVLDSEASLRELVHDRPFVSFRPQRAPADTGGRDLLRGARDVLLASPLFLLAPLYRRRHMRWGATPAEVTAAMPGDEIVSQPSFTATRAITIDAPPEAVWPWLVQVGFGRAGFYSYDLFDNAGRPSAERILPEHQELRVGDWVPMTAKVNETTAFRVEAFEPNRFLLWHKPHSTWAWTLDALPGGRTRLVTRLKDRYSWRADPANAVLSVILFELGDFPMMRKMLRGVKERAEHAGAR